MAKTPSRNDDDYDRAPAKPAAKPAAPAPDDPDAKPPEPTQAEKDKDRPPLAKDEAEQLLRAGTRLRIKGEDPSNWIAMSRHSGDMAISYAATAEAIEEALSHELLVADA